MADFTGDTGGDFSLPYMWGGGDSISGMSMPVQDPAAPQVADDEEAKKNSILYGTRPGEWWSSNTAAPGNTGEFSGNANAGPGVTDVGFMPQQWGQDIGFNGPMQTRDAEQSLTTNPELLQYLKTNNITPMQTVNHRGTQDWYTMQGAKDGQLIGSPHSWQDQTDHAFWNMAMAMAAVTGANVAGAGVTGAAESGAGMEEAAAQGAAQGAGRSSADLAAIYGNQGYGATGKSLLETMGQGALRGSVVNGGLTAAKGGSGSDILKGAAIGGVTGGIGGGISYANPAEYAGISDPQLGKYFNNAISSGVNSSLTGGNIGDALKNSAIGSGVNYGANGVANWANSPGGNMSYDMPDVGTIGGTMQDQYGENSATMGGATIPAQVAANTENIPYTDTAPQQQQNPFKTGVQQFLGMLAPSGASGSGQVSGNGLGNMTGSLMGLYSAWQKRKQLGQLQGGLEGLYGQDSPYAQQLRQTLARHDAASGRRSQIGPREVELQARLAGLNAQMAPTLQNIIGQRNGATNMGMYNLAQLFGNTRLGQTAGDWGQSLYNQFLGSPMAGANVGPQLND